MNFHGEIFVLTYFLAALHINCSVFKYGALSTTCSYATVENVNLQTVDDIQNAC